MFLEKPVFLRYDHEVGKSLCAIKRHEHNLKKRSRTKKLQFLAKKSEDQEEADATTKKQLYKREVKVFQVPFKYDYNAGTPDSLRFLNCYGTSSEEEFLLSEWKELILSKWNSHLPFHMIVAVLFWTFTILTTISMIFLPKRMIFKNLSIYFIWLFMFMEIIQFISYCFFDITK